jgi:hypothetical protein
VLNAFSYAAEEIVVVVIEREEKKKLRIEMNAGREVQARRGLRVGKARIFEICRAEGEYSSRKQAPNTTSTVYQIELD